MAATYTFRLLAAIAACSAAVTGSADSTLNLTLQLTTADFLPVSTMLRAAAEVWGLNETSIQVISATARHAAAEMQVTAGARRLMEEQDTHSNIQLDFATMQRENPKLLTLKDFVMSSNQTPESPSDVLSLLQAFAQFKQGNGAGSTVGQVYESSLERPIDSPSARYALAAMKPSPIVQTQQAQALHAASDLTQKATPATSDIHPHLLFLKTGGGSTVAQPKHQLTPQQLQVLADGAGTLEGLAVSSLSPLTGQIKAADTQQSSQQGSPLQGSTLQQPGPLGIATVVLEANDDSTQQLASLFTPRNNHAIAKAVQTLSQETSLTNDQPLGQGLFSSASGQAALPAGKPSVRPTAKSLQGVYADQPQVDKAGFSALSDSASRHGGLTYPYTLSWLDEPTVYRAEKAARYHEEQQRAIIQGPVEPSSQRASEQLPTVQNSGLPAEKHVVDAVRPTLSKTVLLTLVLRIATDNKEVLQTVVGDSILDRQLQKQIGREGFSVSQLDASFERQGVFSSDSGAFLVQISEATQSARSDDTRVSVRTVVKRRAQQDAAHQDSTQAPLQAGRMPAHDTPTPEQNVQLDLLICIAGFVGALTVLIVGMYKYNTSRAGRQAAARLAAESSSSLWLCGENPLRQPLIAQHPAAEEIC